MCRKKLAEFEMQLLKEINALRCAVERLTQVVCEQGCKNKIPPVLIPSPPQQKPQYTWSSMNVS